MVSINNTNKNINTSAAQDTQTFATSHISGQPGLNSYVLWDPGEVGAAELWGCHDTVSTCKTRARNACQLPASCI